MNNSQNKNISPSIKSFALFLSEFSYLIIILIFVLIGIIFPDHHKSVIHYSKTNKEAWNASSDPLIFTHISDIHISSVQNKEYYKLFREAKKLNASFHLFTGDLGDNYKKRYFPKVGKQNYKDWRLYRNLLKDEFYNETIIDIAGNHDFFGVISPFNKKFGFLNCSYSFNRNNTKTIEDFYVKNISIQGINFILVNPYIFPIVHPPYGFYPHTTKNLLNKLENTINKVGPCSILIHFPIDFFWWKKSSNGKTMGKLMKNKNVQYIFSGHTHPSNYQIKHHEHGGLEFIGTSTKKQKSFGVVTMDNGRLVYNILKYKNNKKGIYFMTHPIPKDQIAGSQIFNERNTEIRIITYDEIINNLIVTGDFIGKMIYQRNLENGLKLYSMPLNIIKNGEYKIKVEGPNCNIEREFYIGPKYKNKKEKKTLSKAFFTLLFISTGIILFFLFIIVFPIKFFNLYYIDDWICGLNEGKCYWFQVIFISPLILNYRINTNIPLYFRIILLFFLIYSLILPFHFFEPIDGETGFSFFCYIFIKGHIIFEEWSIFFNNFYYWGVISPIAIVASSFRFKGSWVYKFNFIFLYFTFVCICVINFRWVGESVKIIFLFFHPCYVIIPIILNILIYISLCRYNNRNKKENETDNLNQSQSNNPNNSNTISNNSFNTINNNSNNKIDKIKDISTLNEINKNALK